jgi:autotransporter-associated beta strand protein
LVLSGENALSGTVYLDRWADGGSLNDGAVRVTDSSSLANVTQFAIRNTSVTTGGGRLELDGTEHEVSVGAPLLTTMRNNNSLGNIRSLVGTNTFAGNVQVLTGGTNVVFQSDAGRLVLAGDVQYVGTLMAARSYSFVGAGDILVTGSLLHASNSAVINIWKSGPGTTTLAGSNSYTGTAFITGGGALRATSPFALSGGPVSIGSGTADTSRLELADDVTFTNSITFAVRANNPAPHIVNVSGTNTLSPAASLSFGAGGNQFALRSDAGKLVLTPGVTVTSGSGKFIYLDGAGDGEIQGALNQSAPANTLSGVIKSGSGTWTLGDVTTTSGTVTNSGGTLVLNGTIAVTNVSVENFAALAGNGIITGPVTIQAGGTLAPGASIGQLTISNTLTLAGTTILELNKAAGTNDSVVGLSSVTYGGTLMVTNLAGALAAGDSFQLFSAESSEGSFSELILPELQPGLAWDTNALSSGALSIVASVPTNPIPLTSLFTGNQLTLAWPLSHLGWRLETNATDLTDANAWFPFPDSAQTNEVWLPIDPLQPHVFYRLVYP